MPKLPAIKPKKLIKALGKEGFFIHFWTGSHCQLKHLDGRRVTIAYHVKDIKPGTLNNIRHQLQITRKEFYQLLIGKKKAKI